MKDEKQEPVRVALYGLFRVTRRTYLAMQVATALGLVVLLTIAILLQGDRKQLDAFPDPPWQVAFLGWASRNLVWVTLGLAALVVLETVIVLRRFASKEAERRASSSGGASSG
jgi:uncharacterized membrane protein YcjF (UPF0283 family)